MKRLFVVAAILVGTALAATSAKTSLSGMAEPGSMVLIGAGLLLTASVARQKLRSRQ